MKKLIWMICWQAATNVYSQDYWQQKVHYDIQVTLNDSNHFLHAEETIVYENQSPDTLTFIWFHLWPNAYKNNTTALYKQLALLDDKKDNRPMLTENGFIDSLDFKVNGQKVEVEAHPKWIDVVKLILPQPLLPGGKIVIATPFRVRIPSYFSRMGHDGQRYMISQWYPKPAVYDRQGWHPMPYLDQGEFYSEFGSFDVQITVPAAYVVAATGVLENSGELNQYIALGRQNREADVEHYELYHPVTAAKIKTLHFHADSVHDFAWFADRKLIINYDTVALPSGRIINIFSFYRLGGYEEWKHSTSFIKDAVLHYSAWLGEYPYPVVNAVQGPGNTSSGGMEYPMITLITSPRAGAAELDGVIAHEVGHNWFYAALGSNEREHPWMDEGINSYYEFRYEAEKYRDNGALGSLIPKDLKKLSEDDFLSAIYNTLNQIKVNRAIETPANAFNSGFEYGMVEYSKAAVWMYVMENALGKDSLEKGMKAYYSDWKFRHPYPKDMETSIEAATQTDLTKLFELLNQKGPL